MMGELVAVGVLDRLDWTGLFASRVVLILLSFR